MTAAMSRDVFAVLQPLLGLPQKARRVVITLGPDAPAVVEVEMLLPGPLTIGVAVSQTQRYELHAIDAPTIDQVGYLAEGK